MTIACMKSIGRQVGHVHTYWRALKHNENKYFKAFIDATSVINLHRSDLILSITLLSHFTKQVKILDTFELLRCNGSTRFKQGEVYTILASSL